MNYVQCNGNDDCPFCRMFKGIPKKKKYLINVIDKKDGRIKVMSMSEWAYKKIMIRAEISLFFKNIWQKILDFFFYLRVWFINKAR